MIVLYVRQKYELAQGFDQNFWYSMIKHAQRKGKDQRAKRKAQ